MDKPSVEEIIKDTLWGKYPSSPDKDAWEIIAAAIREHYDLTPKENGEFNPEDFGFIKVNEIGPDEWRKYLKPKDTVVEIKQITYSEGPPKIEIDASFLGKCECYWPETKSEGRRLLEALNILEKQDG